MCWVAFVTMAASFLLSLAIKWGILEWLQVHAPNDFLYNLTMCKFCCSWWMSVALSLSLLLVTGEWLFLAVPFCSTVIAKYLW